MHTIIINIKQLIKNFICAYYDVISINLKNDVNKIYKNLISFSNDIIVKEYHPFFQFTDTKVSFEYKGRSIKCIWK